MPDDDYEERQDPDDATLVDFSAPIVPSRDARKAYLIVLAGTGVGETFEVADGMLLGRGDDVAVRIPGESVSRQHARIHVERGEVRLEDLGSTNGTIVNGEIVRGERLLRDGDKIQIGNTTVLKFAYHDELEENFQRELYASALRDGLTKTFNKKYFLERIDEEFAFSARHQTPLSLLMLDLDHFKKLNDTYGHLAGDHVLFVLSRAVHPTIRQEDLFARYGGEEFVLLCRSTDIEEARVIAERLQQTVASTDFTFGDHELEVTLSIGVAAAPDAGIEDATGLIEAADEALYQAKRAGRDRVVCRTTN